MAKKYRNLIGLITDPANIRVAHDATARGRRKTEAYLSFKEYGPLNLDILRDELMNGTYRPGPVREFLVHEPKPRLITALPFRDRVAQHALVNIIGPIFEATFLPRSYACRAGKGTHAGVRDVQAELRRMHKTGRPVYYLKTDFAKYFPSIDRSRLHAMIRRKISCAATLRLIETIVPPTGLGLPIGSLTSQLFANVYGGAVDRFLQCERGIKTWFRYMDDIVVLGFEQAVLRRLKADIEAFAGETLGLRFSKWRVAPVSGGINFLGYRIWPKHKLLRKDSVLRAKRRLKHLAAYGQGEDAMQFAAAWQGHAQWADSHNLCRTLNLANDDIQWRSADEVFNPENIDNRWWV